MMFMTNWRSSVTATLGTDVQLHTTTSLQNVSTLHTTHAYIGEIEREHCKRSPHLWASKRLDEGQMTRPVRVHQLLAHLQSHFSRQTISIQMITPTCDIWTNLKWFENFRWWRLHFYFCNVTDRDKSIIRLFFSFLFFVCERYKFNI